MNLLSCLGPQAASYGFYDLFAGCIEGVALPFDHNAWEFTQPVADNKPQPADCPRTQDTHLDIKPTELALERAPQEPQGLPEIPRLMCADRIAQTGFLKHLIDILEAARNVLLQVVASCDDGNDERFAQAFPQPAETRSPRGLPSPRGKQHIDLL